MPTVTAQAIWDAHPYGQPSGSKPCSEPTFTDQCAIRMGVALDKAGIPTASFVGARCYSGLGHSPKHILRAEELAQWLTTQPAVGPVKKHTKKVSSTDFAGKKGIVFIKDGWGGGDHIDIWNGFALKGGTLDYFARGREVWFWELP